MHAYFIFIPRERWFSTAPMRERLEAFAGFRRARLVWWFGVPMSYIQEKLWLRDNADQDHSFHAVSTRYTDLSLSLSLLLFLSTLRRAGERLSPLPCVPRATREIFSRRRFFALFVSAASVRVV